MILASGAFDGLHSGHVAYLAAASALDDSLPLVVAIAPNLYIRACKCREPRWEQRERAETVAALKVVAETVEHPELSIAGVIRRLRPRIVVKGSDWAGKLPADVVAACVEVGAVVRFVDCERTHGASVEWRRIGESL